MSEWSHPMTTNLIEVQYKTQKIEELEKQLAEKDAEISKLKADIQCMCDKAARKYLPGYREMGAKLAEKDAEIERLSYMIDEIQEQDE